MQDKRNCLAKALDEVKTSFPRDMENDKAMLIMTMLLAKKVASHAPSLLRDVFRTTVNFINQNLFSYVRDLVRNVRMSDASPCLLAYPVLTQQSLCCSPSAPPSPPDQPQTADRLEESRGCSRCWWQPSKRGRRGAFRQMT